MTLARKKEIRHKINKKGGIDWRQGGEWDKKAEQKMRTYNVTSSRRKE